MKCCLRRFVLIWRLFFFYSHQIRLHGCVHCIFCLFTQSYDIVLIEIIIFVFNEVLSFFWIYLFIQMVYYVFSWEECDIIHLFIFFFSVSCIEICVKSTSFLGMGLTIERWRWLKNPWWIVQHFPEYVFPNDKFPKRHIPENNFLENFFPETTFSRIKFIPKTVFSRKTFIPKTTFSRKTFCNDINFLNFNRFFTSSTMIFNMCGISAHVSGIMRNVLIFLRILRSLPVVYFVDENVVYENYCFLSYFFQVDRFFTFFTSVIKIWFMGKRGKLVLLDSMKNFYEKC